jgi:hypothetical protein
VCWAVCTELCAGLCGELYSDVCAKLYAELCVELCGKLCAGLCGDGLYSTLALYSQALLFSDMPFLRPSFPTLQLYSVF